MDGPTRLKRRLEAEERQELALETIKNKIWSPRPAGPEVKPIFILTVKRPSNSFGRSVRYLLPTGKEGHEALEDVTALICRAGYGTWNEKTGCSNVKGGDGSDALDSLSLKLFGEYDKLPKFSI